MEYANVSLFSWTKMIMRSERKQSGWEDTGRGEVREGLEAAVWRLW